MSQSKFSIWTLRFHDQQLEQKFESIQHGPMLNLFKTISTIYSIFFLSLSIYLLASVQYILLIYPLVFILITLAAHIFLRKNMQKVPIVILGFNLITYTVFLEGFFQHFYSQEVNGDKLICLAIFFIHTGLLYHRSIPWQLVVIQQTYLHLFYFTRMMLSAWAPEPGVLIFTIITAMITNTIDIANK